MAGIKRNPDYEKVESIYRDHGSAISAPELGRIIAKHSIHIPKRTLASWVHQWRSNDRIKALQDIAIGDPTSETNDYAAPRQGLSAQKPDGTIMTLKEYCDYYKLPYSQAKNFKLVTHTGVPYYNFASHNLNEVMEGPDIDELLEEAVKKHLPKNFKPFKWKPTKSKGKCLQLIYSDTHVGLEPDPGGQSLYGGSWSAEDLQERKEVILSEIEEAYAMYGGFECIQILDLGDFMDGFDGKTVRREHDLPQNMTNEQCFDAGLSFKLDLLDNIIQKFSPKEVISYNVCNSNHSSSFDYMVNAAYKQVSEARYGKGNLTIINERRFIGHFEWGNWVEVITHGKDDKNLKFGFKVQLDPKGKDKIEEYLKHHGLWNASRYICFSKGDSHQYLMDSSTSPDFEYNNIPALSPSSNWVQVNFNRGRSGFVINVKDKFKKRTDHRFLEFKWNSNSLK